MKHFDMFLLGWLALKLVIDTAGLMYLMWRFSNHGGS